MDVLISGKYIQFSTTTRPYSPWFTFPVQKLWKLTIILEFVSITGFPLNAFHYTVPRSFLYNLIPLIIANFVTNILLAVHSQVMLKLLSEAIDRKKMRLEDDLENNPLNRSLRCELKYFTQAPILCASDNALPKFSLDFSKVLRDMRVKIQSHSKENANCFSNMYQNLTEGEKWTSHICFEVKNSEDCCRRQNTLGKTVFWGVLYLTLNLVFICFYLDLPTYRIIVYTVTVLLTLVHLYAMFFFIAVYDTQCSLLELSIFVTKMLEEAKNSLIQLCSPSKDAVSSLELSPNNSIRLTLVFWANMADYFREIFKLEISYSSSSSKQSNTMERCTSHNSNVVS